MPGITVNPTNVWCNFVRRTLNYVVGMVHVRIRFLFGCMRSSASIRTRLNKWMLRDNDNDDNDYLCSVIFALSFRMFQLVCVSMAVVVLPLTIEVKRLFIFIFIAHYEAACRRQVLNHKYCAAPNGTVSVPCRNLPFSRLIRTFIWAEKCSRRPSLYCSGISFHELCAWINDIFVPSDLVRSPNNNNQQASVGSVLLFHSVVVGGGGGGKGYARGTALIFRIEFYFRMQPLRPLFIVHSLLPEFACAMPEHR